MRRTLHVVLAVLIGSAPAAAQTRAATSTAATRDTAAATDTLPPPPPFFSVHDAEILGAYAAGAAAATFFDTRLARSLQTSRASETTFTHDVAAYFRFMGQPAPEIIGVALYGAGRLTHHRTLAALGLHGIEAIVLGTAVTGPVKLIAGRARPYVSQDENAHSFALFRGFKGHDYQSFPSGHATTAFAVASTVTAESGDFWPGHEWLIGTIMYGGAGMVAVSRMYHDAHWASDVVTGAAIGTFSGLKVVEYNHRHPNNFVERTLLGLQIEPRDGGVFLGVTLPVGNAAAVAASARAAQPPTARSSTGDRCPHPCTAVAPSTPVRRKA